MTERLGKQPGTFSKSETELPCDPAILLLGVYLREIKTHVQTKVYTCVFVEALFIIAKKWKHQRSIN